uniref:DUF2065 domain-containing protein n=1 Tax=Ningiella ruwaisensis TaxID=2364274 RepID=UPI0010A02763|nr:DUF2065 domain-containing protein [Ningiella ruwaisensis]
MEIILAALCLLLIFEGIGPLVLPNKWQQFMREMSEQPPEVLRRIGGVLVVIGSVSLYFLLS